MLEGLKTARGIVRSLRIYYGHRARAAAMDRLYGRFVQRGDLVFDVGAHVGDRIASFRRLGARVVAVEPQPALVKVLRLIYGRAADVMIEAVAVGRSSGTTELMINPDNPTVSTASRGFRQRRPRCARLGSTALDEDGTSAGDDARCADRTARRAGLHQDRRRRLRGGGIGRPVAAGQSAVVRVHHDPARRRARLHRTLHRARLYALQRRARREPDFVHADWVDGAAIARWLTELPHEANSGDVYAAIA